MQNDDLVALEALALRGQKRALANVGSGKVLDRKK
jgi:hypothetical protein